MGEHSTNLAATGDYYKSDDSPPNMKDSTPPKSENGDNTKDVDPENLNDDYGKDTVIYEKIDEVSAKSNESGIDFDKPSNTDEYQFTSSIPSPQSPCSSKHDAKASTPEASNSDCKSEFLIRKLRTENEKLKAEVKRLNRLVISQATQMLQEDRTGDKPEDMKNFKALETELHLMKEAFLSLKSERRRLKTEKFDLLNQMKQLYGTLEDKELELRDFIRAYEQRTKQSETSRLQLSAEREERERERWSLLRHARDEAERSLSLAAQLNAKELQLQQTQEQLQDARRQLLTSLSDQESLASFPTKTGQKSGSVTPRSGRLFMDSQSALLGDRGSCSVDSGVRISSDRESGVTSSCGNLSDSTTDGAPTIALDRSSLDTYSIKDDIYQPLSSIKDSNQKLCTLDENLVPCTADNHFSRSVEQLNSSIDSDGAAIGRRSKTNNSRISCRSGTWGSISRVFARSKSRGKVNMFQDESAYDLYRNWSPLTEEGYAEKLRLLREASSIPMEKWRASTVLAWIEIALGMPQYGIRCAENIKSGKVLLELSDFELECGLGITHAMHKKKLRLAIEEHRHPSLVRYPCIAQLGHTWVSSEWLPDLGLSQYSEAFTANMVDARILEHLSKKELEKYLGVTRKFHQASIVHGIQLLRIMKYDRQALAVRRHQCENVDTDPLVWTNQRFIRWIRNIDLGEYAENLKDSGIHGGLVVLEPSFNGDTMATALGIPASKNIIRRHLTAELEALILPARYVIFCQVEDMQGDSRGKMDK